MEVRMQQQKSLLGAQIKPLRKANARLTHENNQLHLQIIRQSEQTNQSERETSMRLNTYESIAEDLRFKLKWEMKFTSIFMPPKRRVRDDVGKARKKARRAREVEAAKVKRLELAVAELAVSSEREKLKAQTVTQCEVCFHP